MVKQPIVLGLPRALISCQRASLTTKLKQPDPRFIWTGIVGLTAMKMHHAGTRFPFHVSHKKKDFHSFHNKVDLCVISEQVCYPRCLERLDFGGTRMIAFSKMGLPQVLPPPVAELERTFKEGQTNI